MLQIKTSRRQKLFDFLVILHYGRIDLYFRNVVIKTGKIFELLQTISGLNIKEKIMWLWYGPNIITYLLNDIYYGGVGERETKANFVQLSHCFINFDFELDELNYF